VKVLASGRDNSRYLLLRFVATLDYVCNFEAPDVKRTARYGVLVRAAGYSRSETYLGWSALHY